MWTKRTKSCYSRWPLSSWRSSTSMRKWANTKRLMTRRMLKSKNFWRSRVNKKCRSQLVRQSLERPRILLPKLMIRYQKPRRKSASFKRVRNNLNRNLSQCIQRWTKRCSQAMSLSRRISIFISSTRTSRSSWEARWHTTRSFLMQTPKFKPSWRHSRKSFKARRQLTTLFLTSSHRQKHQHRVLRTNLMQWSRSVSSFKPTMRKPPRRWKLLKRRSISLATETAAWDLTETTTQ